MDFHLQKDTRIYVAGHKGLIGSAFIRFFEKNSYTNIVVQDRNQLDLCSKEDTFSFFQENQPEVVILAAGRVGGIIQNRDFPADFIIENLSIQLNVFSAAQKYCTKKLIFFASSCMYPRDADQPMKEDQLISGHFEPTSIAYATAKFAGVQLCQAINRQTNSLSFIPVIPNTVYGFNDNFSLNGSHVLPALLKRFHEAKENNLSSVTLWGSGMPRREFIFSEDVVEACLVILNAPLTNDLLPINIGTGSDISIKTLAEKIKAIIDYSGSIKWDKSKPDGAPRKLLDSSRLDLLNWKAKVNLDEGIEQVYHWYTDNN